MSLSYNLSNTKLWAQSHEPHTMPEWPVVNTIILVTPLIGIGSFTEKNIDEVVARIRFVEMLNGKLMYSGVSGKELAIPESIIRDLVGLTTNVANETRASFTKRLISGWFTDTLRDLQRQQRNGRDD